MKELGLPASELLQEAVRVEIRRRELLDNTDDYLDKLLAEVGEPDASDIARAEALVRRLVRNADREAG